MVDTDPRLAALRALYPQHNINAYIVPSEDAHQSEYLAECDCRRTFISGFDGSAGFAIVTESEAGIFTDGRYYLQAEEQINSSWHLVKMGLPTSPSKADWLKKHLSAKMRVGVDPTLMPAVEFSKLKKELHQSSIGLVAVKPNLIDEIWTEDRPKAPEAPVFVLEDKYAGKSVKAKLEDLRKAMADEKQNALVMTSLDEIAWLFNLRGADVQYNPVFFSYALVTKEQASLFLHINKVNDSIRSHLREADVQVAAYESFFEALEQQAPELCSNGGSIWVGPRCSSAVASLIPGSSYSTSETHTCLAKSVKNEVELEGMSAIFGMQSQCANFSDGWKQKCQASPWDEFVYTTYKYYSEQASSSPELPLTEVDLADKLEGFRSQQRDYVSLSFATISSVGANGAIIHYHPRPGTCAKFRTDTLYLLDSGGQYRDGTTDVTRTCHLGKDDPTPHMKKCFTRVLQGHIDLDRAVFPNGTSGLFLDSFARRPLWADGLDYRHGTGHGVGSFLNVHEGPIGIHFRKKALEFPLKECNIVTNEPGYYEDGQFGIRIENTVEVVSVKPEHNFKDVGFLGFKPVTLVPIQSKMIDVSLLSPEQIKWVDDYHQRCLEVVGTELKLQGKAEELKWLEDNTKPLVRV